MMTLEVVDLTKRLGKRTIVNRVSFRLTGRDFFVLLGPPQSGKTMLLRLICGLEKIDAGKVIINERDVTRMGPEARNLGVLFNDRGLLPQKNVYENIAFSLRLRHMNKAEIDMRVIAVAHSLRLTHLLTHTIAGLNKEEHQRIALARALVRDAEAYLFDQPLLNMEEYLRFRARQELLMVPRITNAPAIYVAHDQIDAFAMESKVAVMHEGTIQQIGTREELLSRPANTFVASYLGLPPMDILAGYLQRLGTRFHLLTGDLILPLPIHWTPVMERLPIREILFAVRPHAFVPEWELDTLQNTPDRYLFQTVITDAQPQEGKAECTQVKLRVSEQEGITAVFYHANARHIRPGQGMTIGLDTTHLCLFDPRTGSALPLP